jgi:DNA-binding transcriptional LysR family regulator
MRSLNLDQLRSLETVVALGSFTGAAKRLNLSQSAVSTQIRELEERFGVQLVERLGKRAFATPAGREVIDHARRIAQESDSIVATMRRYRENWLGRVRIGASTTALIYHLPPVLQRLRARHPNVELVVTTGTTSGVAERIAGNEIDVGVVSLPVDERSLEVVPLREERLVAIFPAGASDIPAKATPQTLARHTLLLEYARANVRRLIMAWLSIDGTPPRPAMELDNLEAVKRMVAAGLGASVVPEAAVCGREARPDIAVRPLAPRLTRTLGYMQRRGKKAEPALKIVREAIIKELGTAQPGAGKRGTRDRG